MVYVASVVVVMFPAVGRCMVVVYGVCRISGGGTHIPHTFPAVGRCMVVVYGVYRISGGGNVSS